MTKRTHARSAALSARGASGWKIGNNDVITKAGSLVSDLVWDFRSDHDSLGLCIWDRPIRAGGLVVGRLSDPAYRNILSVLQQAVSVRWRYSQREDGHRWEAKRAHGAASASRTLAVWLVEAGVTNFKEIRESVVEAWVSATAKRIDGGKRQPQDHRILIDALLLPWRVRDRIDVQFTFEPAHSFAHGYQPEKSTCEPTPLLPKVVLEHIIGAALRYVEVYSSDILAARNYIDKLAKDWERERGRSRPVFRRGCPEYRAFDSWISKRFGYQDTSARAQMGSVAPWNDTGLFVLDPDTGQPWLQHIRTRRHLQQLENSLRTASYLVIAFLTGGRNTEVNQFRTDCIRVVRGSNGRADECYVRGVVTKGRGAEPQEVDWGVPDAAVKAAGILLKMMQAWRVKTGSDRLFVTQTGQKMVDHYYNTDIREFVDRIGTPYVNGAPARVTTHMLRVALAQWLGAEPHGEIAGAFHLKQLSTAAFRGYLREDPNFQSLYEGFVLQSSADHLQMLLEEPSLGGKMGEKILASRTPERQAELERSVRGLNLAQVGREAPSERTIAKLRRTNRPIYLTSFSTCVFSGPTAECLKEVPLAERTQPRHTHCEPFSCANSTISRLQVPFYLEDYEAYAAMAGASESTSSQVELARAEMARLSSVILPHAPTLNAERNRLSADLVGADPREALTVSVRKRLNVVEDLLARMVALGPHEPPLDG